MRPKQLAEKHLVTFDEFLIGVREDQKADLIDGVIYMASPESLEGNGLVFWIARLLADYIDEKGLGKVYVSRVAFRLAKHQGPEPDVAFVQQARLHLCQYGFFGGAPGLAVEVVSPDSVTRDYEAKRKQYQDAGVREYLIVDELLPQVLLPRLQDGKFVEVPPTGGVHRFETVPGFWQRPEWLLRLPRPKKSDVLAQLLAP